MSNRKDFSESAHKPLSRPLNRRRFLQFLGAVGGTGAVLGAMDALEMGIASAQDTPPNLTGQSNGRRVVILGAGLAGMTAAYELGKLGYETPILEARDFAGGRCQTARRGFSLSEADGDTQTCNFDEGHYINHGAWRIPYNHRSTLHYTREFGVPLEVMVNDNPAAYALYEQTEGEVTGPLAGTRIRRMQAQADMRGYEAEMLAKAANQDRLEMTLSPEDKEKFVAFLVHEGYLDSEDLAYKGTSGRGYEVNPGAGVQPGEGAQSDPFSFTPLLHSEYWNLFRSVSSFTQQPAMLQPIGGMDKIAEGFEGAVGSDITYNAEVKEIRQSADGVRIVYEDTRSGETSEVTGDYCLCTIPLSVLGNIPADFAGVYQDAIGSVAYTPTGKMGLQFGRRFWETEDHIYGGHSATNFFGSISYPSGGWQEQKGVILGYYNFGGTAVEVSNMSSQERIQYALDNGERLHPGQYQAAFEQGFSVAWHLVPYSLGGWANWSDETRASAYPLLNEPDGRIYLAGEHLSYLTGWQAGAIESAWLQLEKIHQRASQEAGWRRNVA